MAQRKVNLKTASLKRLEFELSMIQSGTESVKAGMGARILRILRMAQLDQKIAPIKAEIAKLEAMKQPVTSVIGRLLGKTELTPSAAVEIQRLVHQSYPLQDERARLQEEEWHYSYAVARAEGKKASGSKLIAEIEKRRRKADVLNDLKAAAVSNDQHARKIGANIRRQLVLSNNCPYCGELLGDEPHADHIYPIAKGGRSTNRNMVYVCADCNMKKGKLTLVGFIKKLALDRESIETRLDQLGKDY